MTKIFGSSKNVKRLYAGYNGVNNCDFDWERFKAAEKEGELSVGELYVVEEVAMGQSSTDITLQGVDKKYACLNSVPFDFAVMKKGQLKAHDIYEDKEFNPYL